MMQYNPSLTASAEVPVTADIAGLIRAAGGDPAWATYDAGTSTLRVRGFSQEVLDAAMVTLDPLFSGRQQKKMLARDEFDQRISAGLPWRGKVADIDEASTNRITSVAAAAERNLVSGGIPWRMKDNSFLMLDASGLLAMASAAFVYVAGLRAHYWTIVDAAKAAADQDALDQINPGAGWPDPPASPPA